MLAGLYLLYRRAVLPATILALGLAGFGVLGVADLPLLRRYLFPAGAALALFCAVAMGGWLLLERDNPRRRHWAIASIAVISVVLTTVPGTVGDLRDTSRQNGQLARLESSLRSLLFSPRANSNPALMLTPTNPPAPATGPPDPIPPGAQQP